MMYGLSIAIVSLFVLYLVPVLGLMIYCENDKELLEVKRFVYLVPFLTLAVSVSYIIDACKGDKCAVEFLKENNKQFIVLLGIYALPEVQEIIIQVEKSIKRYISFQNSIFNINFRNFFRCIQKSLDDVQKYIEAHAFML